RQLGTREGARGVDVLRAALRALADERAAPDPLVLGQDLHPLAAARVARIEVVALREGDRGRPDEVGVEPVDRACGVAQHAVDAHAELLELVELLRRLAVLAVGDRPLVLGRRSPHPWLPPD